MIRILVDSSSDYSPELAAENGIEVLPLIIVIDSKEYRDGIDLGRDEFYEIIKSSKDFPHTSQATPQVFMKYFKAAQEAGDDLICLTISSELSGTYESAVTAKETLGYNRIFVVDSRAATYIIRILADYAAKLRDEGKTAEEIVDALNALKGKVKVIAGLDTLEYLQRGGRLPRGAALMGEMAKLKPLIEVTPEGKMGVLGGALGRKKARLAVMKHLAKVELNPDFPLYTIYSFGTKNCEEMEHVLVEHHIIPTERLQIGSIIGCHIGPEAFGVVYVEK